MKDLWEILYTFKKKVCEAIHNISKEGLLK